jgi:hypothetical protein
MLSETAVASDSDGAIERMENIMRITPAIVLWHLYYKLRT